MKNIYLYSYVFIICILCFASCKKTEQPSQILIASISPNAGFKDTEVTITGTGFDLNAANNIVLFNGKPATVLEATENTLKVKSPAGAGTGVVEVSRGSSKGFGPIFYHRWTATVSTLTSNDNSLYIDLAIDSLGNLYTTCSDKNVYKITPNGVASTLTSLASFPYGIAVNTEGVVYVASDAYCIYKIVNGQKTVFVGKENAAGDIDAQGAVARLKNPKGLAIDKAGNLYLVDIVVEKIKKITPDGNVTTILTNQKALYYNAEIDKDENLWIAEGGTVLKIMDGTKLGWIGNGVSGYQDGAATSATVSGPFSTLPILGGDIFMSDGFKLRYLTQDGYVLTAAGNDNPNFIVKDGIGKDAQFKDMRGMVVDKNNNLFIADYSTIRKIVLD